MKPLKLLCAGAMTLAALAAGATDVGVSVQISQPGVYGRIDIGRFPQPQVVVAQPVVVVRPVVVAQPAPVYMWVPPGHRKHWAKHCHRYAACGVPVYFVRHDWYDHHVQPRAQWRGHGDDHDRGRGKVSQRGKARDD
ncbi:MAG: hypothetical protein HS128_03815 [Ideonella sp.]|nr:hypothetical protein [Ideonella sp.]MCC7456581.1 hypothetical protein [Nitrospira sp.]